MRLFPRLVAAVVVAALSAWPLAAADAGQQGHGPKKETPAAKAATPAAKAETPAAKPATPAAKPATPAAKPATPAAKPVTSAAKPETHAAKTDSHAPKAEAAKPPAAKPDAAKDAPSVEDVVKRINAILAEGPGPDTSRKAGAEHAAGATAPKPSGTAYQPRAAARPPVTPTRPTAPAARTARTGVILRWDATLTKRGVALVWDAELTGAPEPARPGVKLLWPER